MSWGATKVKRANALAAAGIVWCDQLHCWTLKKFCRNACAGRGNFGDGSQHWKNKKEALEALRLREAVIQQQYDNSTKGEQP